MSQRDQLGWNDFFEQQLHVNVHDGEHLPVRRVARVVVEQRGRYRIDGDEDGWAVVSGRFRHEAATAADFPAVGDWVGVDHGIIHRRLERRSAISRAAAGRAVEQQVVAANVDVVFLVTALSQDLNTRRLERYLTMVWDAGAMPVVLLNKADLCEDALTACESVRCRLPMIDLIVMSALRNQGVEALEPYLRPAQTVALLGSSGVGKSTLVNRLLGSATQRVGELDTDSKGRHTTTSRQLVTLPGGALLIDTPGMRELQPWTDEAAVEGSFDDITSLANGCRFSDCAHANEPDCAVRLAVERGQLAADRLESFRRLLREAAFEAQKRDKRAASAAKRKWKQIHMAQRAQYRDRNRG